jgi:starch synthase
VGGVPELVESGQQGLLVRPGNRREFVRAMQSLLYDPTRRLAMATAARTRAMREFRLERMVQGYTDLYQSVITGLRKPPDAGVRARAAFHGWEAGKSSQ